jgi:hypothetical protein
VSATDVARSSAIATGSWFGCGFGARARLRGFAAGGGVPAASGFGSEFERDVVFFAIYLILTSGARRAMTSSERAIFSSIIPAGGR